MRASYSWFEKLANYSLRPKLLVVLNFVLDTTFLWLIVYLLFPPVSIFILLVVNLDLDRVSR
jgi:hypothetical protein